MNRKEVREAYGESTAMLSAVSRQLNYAGIAVIWIFKTNGPESGGIVFSQELLFPLMLFVGSLSLDLLHYFYKSIAWGIFNRYKETKDVKASTAFTAPLWINGPSLIFFWLKVLFTLIANMVLIQYIATRLLH